MDPFIIFGTYSGSRVIWEKEAFNALSVAQRKFAKQMGTCIKHSIPSFPKHVQKKGAPCYCYYRDEEDFVGIIVPETEYDEVKKAAIDLFDSIHRPHHKSPTDKYSGQSNFQLALNWVDDTSENTKAILSDQFFSPFDKKERIELLERLTERGYDITEIGNNGALIIKK